MTTNSKPHHAPAKSALKHRVHHLIVKTTSVPAFPVTVHKLFHLTSQRKIDLREVAEVVKLDPGLATKFLQMANSAFYTGESVSSIEEAVLRIGMNEVRKLTLLIGMMDGLACFHDPHPVTRIDHRHKIEWEVYWLHSLLTARIAERLAATCSLSGGKGYLAGLLHDVGKLFLQQHFSDEFGAVVVRAMERHEELHETEDQLLDITHAEVGGLLAEKWKLHEEIGGAMRNHHAPAEPPREGEAPAQRLIAGCLQVADTLAKLAGTRIEGGQPPAKIDFGTVPGWSVIRPHFQDKLCWVDPCHELKIAQELIGLLQADRKAAIPRAGA